MKQHVMVVLAVASLIMLASCDDDYGSCRHMSPGSHSNTDGDGNWDADSDTDTTCVHLTSGTWNGTGDGFPMDMSVVLTMNEGKCSFTLEWPMNHINANGGTIAGNTVTLFSNDSSYFETCVGQADTVTHVAGICSDDGAVFELTAQ